MKIINLNESVYKSKHPDKARKRYRKLMGIGMDEKIENIDDWAVGKVAVECNESVDKVKHWLTEDIEEEKEEEEETILTEDEDDDITIDAHNKKAAAEVDAVAQIDEDTSKGVIEKTLDRLLKVNKLNAKRGHTHFNNVLFEGAAGTGKTSRILAWAKENGVNLLIKKANELDTSDFGVVTHDTGSDVATKVRTSEFDLLDRTNSVLFLDEYNRAPANVRATMLTLVNDHVILDPQGEGGVKYFPNFLFTIAAINPYSASYETKQLDPAEMSRFRHVNVPNEPGVVLSYFNKQYDKWIAESEVEGDMETAKEDRGRKAILNKLLTHPEFNFDDEEDEMKVMEEGNRLPLNSRSLESLISDCDGTKEDFLGLWDEYVNNFKKPMAELILKDYVDIDDKANQAIGKGSKKDELKKKAKSSFGSKKTLRDELDDILNNL